MSLPDNHALIRTPLEWMALKHPQLAIYDSDGWRGPNGRPFTDAINEEEFDHRFIQCTVGTSHVAKTGKEPRT